MALAHSKSLRSSVRDLLGQDENTTRTGRFMGFANNTRMRRGELSSVNRIGLAVLLGGLIAGAPTYAGAQGTIVWSDMDCSQSKLVIAASLHCRATNVFGSRGAPSSTGGGQVKSWNASGTVQQAKLYYYVTEIVDTTTSVKVATLSDDIRVISPQAKSAANMSGLEKKGDADFVTFNNAQNDNCVGSASTVRRGQQGTAGFSTRPAARRPRRRPPMPRSMRSSPGPAFVRDAATTHP